MTHDHNGQRRRATDNLGFRKFFENNWEMMSLWTILIGLFFLLRPFFLLIFETFLITYIMRHAVLWTVKKCRMNYILATFLLFALAVGLFGSLAAWVGPRLGVESNRVIMELAGSGTNATIANVNTAVERMIGEIVGPVRSPGLIASEEYGMIMDVVRVETEKAVNSAVPRIPGLVIHFVKMTWELAFSLLLAVIFSFILVLDWEKIAGRIRQLEGSRIRAFYRGAAPHLAAFADILGKTIRAQAVIAICNTILTALGIWLLGLPHLALLSTIVFFCGFIPILGTFLSSIPILLFGAQVGGVVLMLKLTALIVLVHAFEAYILNPRITANVLHAHPILILVLLLIGERFFGLWGMVLGVPIGFYVITILAKSDPILEKESLPDMPPRPEARD